jgi:hypothetical protein
MVTLEEANALLPKVHRQLKTLRDHRQVILRTQAQIEIEEMTGSNSKGEFTPEAKASLTQWMETFHQQTRQFEQILEDLLLLGVQIKDLDAGLVDFYSRRGEDIVFLCWKEGEAEIRHWHTLQGGFQNRKPL